MEAVGRLAGGVAHDFNNLLAVIMGELDLLVERVKDPEVHKSATRIQEASRRAATLTRQMLAFSRRQVLEARVVSLNDIVRDTCSLLNRTLGEDIELVTRFHPQLGSINADPVQIEQVLLNLAINARDAMPRGGRLVIETANSEVTQRYVQKHPPMKPGSFVLLIVSDTGCGMDAETQAHIFEPFFTTKGASGTGLGLATTYGIVKQSGGYIWVYSEPGAGSMFKIFLPRVDAAPSTPQPSPAVSIKTNHETVLVAEDQADLLEVTADILAGAGYRTFKAADGQSALGVLKDSGIKIDVLLTDIVMSGGMSGIELMREAQAISPGTKIVLMSGYSTEMLKSQARPLTAAFLQKPFAKDDLIEKIAEVLASASAQASQSQL
jgi:CheY-like chemotaxis protein